MHMLPSYLQPWQMKRFTFQPPYLHQFVDQLCFPVPFNSHLVGQKVHVFVTHSFSINENSSKPINLNLPKFDTEYQFAKWICVCNCVMVGNICHMGTGRQDARATWHCNFLRKKEAACSAPSARPPSHSNTFWREIASKEYYITTYSTW